MGGHLRGFVTCMVISSAVALTAGLVAATAQGTAAAAAPGNSSVSRPVTRIAHAAAAAAIPPNCVTAGATCVPDGKYTLSYSVTGTGCSWTANIDWGDEKTSIISYGDEGFSEEHAYAKSGLYDLSVTGSGTSPDPNTTCTFVSSSTQIEVPLDHFVLEMQSWIPQRAVVDPVHPVTYRLATSDMYRDCGRIPNVTSESSTFAGDGHVGYDGSVRVREDVSFDWNLQQVSNVDAAPLTNGVTTRIWVITTRNSKTPIICKHAVADHGSGSAAGSGNIIGMVYRSADPQILNSPPIHNTVTATVSNSDISLDFGVTAFPSQGFAIYENGAILDREVFVNPSCEPVLGPEGFFTLLRGLTTHESFRFTVATDAPSGDIVASC